MVIDSRVLYVALVAAVGLERLYELWLSKRNAARAFARGAVEHGRDHYGTMAAFHTLFLIAAAIEPYAFERQFPGALGWAALATVVAAQALRYWAISTLGDRWNTRVIVEPNASVVTGGPYRFLRHPNYVAVALELLALPLVHGAFATAALFSIGNIALLSVRIRVEEQALGARWEDAFHDKPRFIPGARSEH